MRRLRTAIPYVLAFVLVGVGIFSGLVGQRMVKDGDSLPEAVIRSVVNVPTPQEVFHKDRLYVMLLGIDYDYDDKDQPYSSHSRSDTIMVAGLDFPTKSTRLISVLRDSDVVIGGRETKINAAYSEGGVRLADTVVGDFLGMPADLRGKHFDRYVVVRVSALKDLVDAIGGIDVHVKDAMDYDDSWGHLHIHFKPGLVHMNGEQAQGYARFRHDACSDPCRTKRQQEVIRVVIDKLKGDRLNDLAHIGQLISVFRRDVDTNLSVDELKALAFSFKNAKTADLAHADTIGYVDTKQTPDGETVIPDEHQKALLVADLLGAYQTAAPPAPAAVAAVLPSSVHVVVENGSGIRGAATQLAGRLKGRGYIIDSVGDAESFSYDSTQIRTSADAVTAGARVRADIGLTSAAVSSRAELAAKGGAVHVIVGKDYAQLPHP